MRFSPSSARGGGPGERGTTRREDREIHENGSRRPDSPRSSASDNFSRLAPRPHHPFLRLVRTLSAPPSAPVPSRAISLARTAPLRSSPGTLAVIPTRPAPCPSLLPAPPLARRPAPPAFRSTFTWVHGRSNGNIPRRENALASLTVFFTSLLEIFALVLGVVDLFSIGLLFPVIIRASVAIRVRHEYLEYRELWYALLFMEE